MDLTPQQLEQVRVIFRQHMPTAKVYAFGSRVRLTAKAHSDLDLVIVGESAIPLQRMQLLEEAFSESDLPFHLKMLQREDGKYIINSQVSNS